LGRRVNGLYDLYLNLRQLGMSHSNLGVSFTAVENLHDLLSNGEWDFTRVEIFA
jgi:hypothetical protein